MSESTGATGTDPTRAERRAATGAPAARVTAVLVTWNRRELLLRSLAAVEAQTHRVTRIVLVDNASTDGTAAAVRAAFPRVEVVPLATNTGGAGGFAEGVRRALDPASDPGAGAAADWLWLMDDDTIPRSTALAELVAAHGRFPDTAKPVLLASRVLWTDGTDHPMNSPRERYDRRWSAEADAAGCTSIRSASFVSVLVGAAAARRTPPPVADYFIWNDDFEYTARLLRRAPGALVPTSVVLHATTSSGRADADPGDRFSYEVRNKLWAIGRSSAFTPAERVLYGAAAATRWAGVVRRSDDRATLLRAAGRGAREGLLKKPGR